MTIVFKKCLQAAEPLFRQGLSNPQVADATGFSLPTLAKARKLLGIAPLRRGRPSGFSPANLPRKTRPRYRRRRPIPMTPAEDLL